MISRRMKVLVGSLLLFGATGAAAAYVGRDTLLGPSFEAVHGVECSPRVAMQGRDPHGTMVRQIVAAETEDGSLRLKTAARVAESIMKEKSPHLVQVSVVDGHAPKDAEGMRGRAVGAKVLLIADPKGEAESRAGSASGFAIDGEAAFSGEFYGKRLDVDQAELDVIRTRFDETTGCTAPGPTT